MNDMKYVLVAGGAGYIGSHVCKALSMDGYTPVVYDNLSQGYKQAVKWGVFEYGDLQDVRRLRDVITAYQPVAVMHFAASIAAGESVVNPGKYYWNNTAGSICLIEAAVDSGIRDFIFSSTAAVYGDPVEVPISETHRILPVNPYGHSKAQIEQILRDFDVAHGLRSVCLRYFNAAGADVDGEVGEAHDPETHLIPLILEAAGGKRPDIKVYGTDYATPDGTCIRDYIHVADLAQAHVLALKALEGGGRSKVYNLGNGNGYSVKEVIDAASRVTERNIVVDYQGRRAGDPPVLVADSTLIAQELGWRPEYPDIDEIIRTAWRWHGASF